MKIDSAQEAISAALKGNWNQAIEINEQILLEEKDNTDALNRLARAYSETGNLKKAKDLAQKVLKLDPFNPIATKSLQKWQATNGHIKEASSGTPRNSTTFLEHPGKTKIANLLNLADGKTLANLDTGDELKLMATTHRVSVTTNAGTYVGRLPDDLSARLCKLIKLGNKYEVFVKSIDGAQVKIFLRETERSEKLRDVPSFSTEKIDYISFTPPELVHKKEFINSED